MLKKIDGKKVYIGSAGISTFGAVVFSLGVHQDYNIFLMTHGISLVIFGAVLAAVKHAVVKVERLIIDLIKKLEK